MQELRAHLLWSALLVLLLAASSTNAQLPSYFQATDIGLPNNTMLWWPAWGDYDNDGDLDFLGYGATLSAVAPELFRNDNGLFTRVSSQLSGFDEPMSFGGAAWGDYDNDGDLDFFLCGNSSTGGWRTRLYTNIRSPNFDNTFQRRDLNLNNATWSGTVLGGVSWGDWDLDGDLELLYTGTFRAAGGGVTHSAMAYLNRGTTPFSDSDGMPLITRAGPFGVAWADVDKDGDLDGLTYGTGNVLIEMGILYSTPDGLVSRDGIGLIGGGFGENRFGYGSVTWGDYDNDGDLDFYANGLDNMANTAFKSYMYVCTGFSVSNSPVFLINLMRSCDMCKGVWGDYDGDTDLDLMVTTWPGSQEYTYLYQTDVASGPTPTYLNWASTGRTSGAAFGDYDADGDLDLLIGGAREAQGKYFFYRNNLNSPSGCPCSTFGPPIGVPLPALASNSANMITAALLDTDAFPEVFVASAPPLALDNRISGVITDALYWTGWGATQRFPYRQLGNPLASDTYPSLGYNVYDMVVGDIEGDGDNDVLASVLLAGTDSALYKIDNSNGGTSFNSTNIFRGNARNTGLALGQLDSDGLVDFVVPSLSRNATSVSAGWIRNVGSALHVGQELMRCPKTAASAAGDLDGDGSVDVVFSCLASCDPAVDALCTSSAAVAQGATLWVCWNSASGFNSPCVLVDQQLASFALPLTLGDMNNDGLLDIVTIAVPSGSTTKQSQWYRNLGNKALGPRVVIATGTIALTTIHLNDDAALDMVAYNGLKLQQWRNLGNGTFAAPKEQNTRSLTYLTQADLNGDNRADIIGVNQANGAVLWHRRLQGKLRAQAQTSASPSPTSSPSASSLPSSTPTSTPPPAASPDPSSPPSPSPIPSASAVASSPSPSSAPSPSPPTEVGKYVFGFSSSVTVGDLNNDAKVDIIVVDGTDHQVTVFDNRGQFTFGQMTIEPIVE